MTEQRAKKRRVIEEDVIITMREQWKFGPDGMVLLHQQEQPTVVCRTRPSNGAQSAQSTTTPMSFQNLTPAEQAAWKDFCNRETAKILKMSNDAAYSRAEAEVLRRQAEQQQQQRRNQDETIAKLKAETEAIRQRQRPEMIALEAERLKALAHLEAAKKEHERVKTAIANGEDFDDEPVQTKRRQRKKRTEEIVFEESTRSWYGLQSLSAAVWKARTAEQSLRSVYDEVFRRAKHEIPKCRVKLLHPLSDEPSVCIRNVYVKKDFDVNAWTAKYWQAEPTM